MVECNQVWEERSGTESLGWFAGPSGRPELDARNLFLLVARECFRDGLVDAADNLVLNRLCRFLRVDGSLMVRLMATVRNEFLDGRLPLGDALDRRDVFLRACRFAREMGDVSIRAGRLLAGLAQILELEPAPGVRAAVPGSSGAPVTQRLPVTSGTARRGPDDTDPAMPVVG